MLSRPNGSKVFLIAVEGPDRVGKATQAKKLQTELCLRGIPAVLQEIPHDDGVTYPEIYRMLHDGSVREHPLVFQTLHGVNRRFMQARWFPVLMEKYDVIVLDRWSLSTRVYGKADGLTDAQTHAVLRGLVEPDLTFVLDGPPWPKEGLDTLEADDAYQATVRQLYASWCARSPGKIVKINAARESKMVHFDIMAAALMFLGRVREPAK